MYQRKSAGKYSVIGIAIAAACILVYLGSLISVIVRISDSMDRYRLIAEREFFSLTDQASAAAIISFMDDAFIDYIQSELEKTETIEGLIITGPLGRYPFEKERGRAIYFDENNSPRLRYRFGFSRDRHFSTLVTGQRNSNIEAVARAMDSNELAAILTNAMILISIALAVSIVTLLAESMQSRVLSEAKTGDAGVNRGRPKYSGKGIYSDRSGAVREENTELRLTEELRKCAAAGQDLVFIAMEFKPQAEGNVYARFAADAARFFTSREFVCEKGEKGIAIICPGLNLDAGFLNANEFHNRIIGKYPAVFKSKTDVCMGLSARSQRPVNAERLIFEAEEALERALMDPVSHIVAFKSDPDKYRAFMQQRGQG